MTNHPNRGRSRTMFEVVEMETMDTRTFEITYRVVSRHKTRTAAERAVEAAAIRDQKERWPHRPEARNTHPYEIREVNN